MKSSSHRHYQAGQRVPAMVYVVSGSRCLATQLCNKPRSNRSARQHSVAEVRWDIVAGMCHAEPVEQIFLDHILR